MATTVVTFPSTRSPADALDVFVELADQERWEIRDRTPDSAVARRRMNVRTWGNRIAVGAREKSDGTVVEVHVSSWQLVDWGEGQRLAALVQDRLA
jgi:hypothetical protein